MPLRNLTSGNSKQSYETAVKRWRACKECLARKMFSVVEPGKHATADKRGKTCLQMASAGKYATMG